MNKFTFTFLLALLFSVGLSAQNFVSTSAENKNVVLEEFTGIYCTFCPDGHKRAADLAAANPGNVFLINVHAGGFAAPSGNDPDFRTPFGAALATQSQLAGYPAGTINRRNFTGINPQQGSPAGATALSRGDWATAAPIVMAESSPVNVAAEAFIDPVTRELKVVVETYYTANAAASTHKLNVALTQDNVEGPQTGATANPGQVLANGNYNHQHMLRHMLTGQWGVDITTTTMGHFQADTFTYTLPMDINGVPLEMGDIDVVVFLAEGQQNIITGNAANINIVVPAGFTVADLGISPTSTAPSGYCTASFTPQVSVSNPGNSSVAKYAVSYSINGGTPVSQTISTAIAAGATATVTFPATTLTGTSTIAYDVEFVSLNTNVLELTTSNNASSEGPYVFLDGSFTHGSDFTEGFNGAVGEEAPMGSIAVNPNGIRAYTVNASVATGLSNLGGHGNSDGCFRWDYYDVGAGFSSQLIFEEVDLSNAASASIHFTHAYAQYISENDGLEVLVSTDCGGTWTSVFNKTGADLATRAAVNPARFYPTATEWVDNTIDISSLAGQSEVLVAFKGTSAYGNSLYVDDINVESFNVGTKEEVLAVNNLKVFPNPATVNVNIQFNLETAQDMNINITNALGQTVKAVNAGNLSAGQHNFSVNTNGLAAGIYFINFNDGAASTTERFIIAQ